MVPKVVQDAGYTAVGMGVMAAQQVQARPRDARARLSGHARDAQSRLESAGRRLRAAATPVAGQLNRVPRLPGPLGSVVDSGRKRLQDALR